MSLYLFNTLTGRKEEFKPIKSGQVNMYNCGPTVYNYAHIGNLRAYVFVDVLRRTLEYNGYKVKQVMNITDVGHLTSDNDDGDDKMVKALKRDNLRLTLEAMRQVADKYTEAFKEDLKALNCEMPDEMPRASDHIKEDIELIKILEEKGFAYKTSDGLYFDISKYPAYGKLGNINLKGQLAGARVAVNSEKKNPGDFTLWKKSSNDIGWESPWGKGFPGWHIECSAMSRKYLSQPFDIHTGGIDHIPVHHNNEIAQSEAAFGAPLAKVWMHNEHLVVPSGKMAKSAESFLTLKKLVMDNVISDTISYRFWLLGVSYRKPIDYSEDALWGARVSYGKLLEHFGRLDANPGKVNLAYREKFLSSVNDDLNTPVGLSIVWKLLDDKNVAPEDKRETILDFNKVLGLSLGVSVTIPENILKLVEKRQNVRLDKDFKKSDELRAEIEKEGYEVMDTDSGPVVRKRLS